MIKKFCSVTFLLMSILITNGQNKWILKKDKDGIKVFTKNVDTSKFKAIKVECVLDGTIGKFDSIIRNVENHKSWVYSTKKSFLVKVVNKTEIIYYTETSLPWPASNRDVIIQMQILKDSVNNSETINASNLNGVINEKSGIVRVRLLSMQYYVHLVNEHKISITFNILVDPSGSIPAWIVNAFAVKGPFETFSKLGDFLKQ